MAKCKGDMETFYGLAKGGIEPIGILFRWLNSLVLGAFVHCSRGHCRCILRFSTATVLMS